jgi:hypothetical protein
MHTPSTRATQPSSRAALSAAAATLASAPRAAPARALAPRCPADTVPQTSHGACARAGHIGDSLLCGQLSTALRAFGSRPLCFGLRVFGWPHLREPVLLLVDNFHCFFFLLLHALERRLLLGQPYLQTLLKLRPATSAARIARLLRAPSLHPIHRMARYGKRRGANCPTAQE